MSAWDRGDEVSGALSGAYREGWAARRLLGGVPWLARLARFTRWGGVSNADLGKLQGGTGGRCGRGRESGARTGVPELKGRFSRGVSAPSARGVSWTSSFPSTAGGSAVGRARRGPVFF